MLRRGRRSLLPLHLLLALVLLHGNIGAPSAWSLPPGGPSGAAGEQRISTPAPGFVPEWSWPLLPVPRVLRAFDKPAQKWQPGHRGVDLAAEGTHAGTVASGTVLSPAPGVVSFAGRVVDRGVVSIDHGNGQVSSFEPVDASVTKGQRVEEGEAVATITLPSPGGTGAVHCADPCLHWGVRVDGEYVDPLGFVSDRRPSVLLPMSG